MRFIQSIEARLRQAERLQQLAEQIAGASFERVWQRVHGQVYSLQPAEARGYVRARARLVVDDAVAVAAADLGTTARCRLHVLTMNAIMRRVTNQVDLNWLHHARRNVA